MKVTLVLLVAATAVMAQNTYTATGVGCEPHDDHWHCPAGVAEPTTPPASAVTSGSSDSRSLSTDTVTATVSGVCEPHDDHWHCPAGVAEPTTPPAASASTTSPSITRSSSALSHSDDDHDDHVATASTCVPHNDHWHCPSGVAEPTTPPAISSGSAATATISSGSAATTTTTRASSASVSQATGAGVAIGATKGGIMAALLGAIAYVL